MSITLVHHFHTQVGPVEDVSPGRNNPTLRVHNRLVEVEPVQVERHRADAQCREPDANHRPCTQEEVQGTGVVEAGVLEDQATEVAVSRHNVVGLFFLPELVAVVLRLRLGRLTHQGRGDERTVHGAEQGATKHTGNAQHVEGVHQDVVLCLEHEHEVEGTGNTQGHPVREGALTDRVDQEDRRCCCNRRAVSNGNPRPHSQAVAQFPFPSHVAEDANQEVQHNQLVGTAVVQPLIEGSGFPDGVQVQADGVGRRDNRTRDDVVTVQKGAGNGATDAVDVHGGAAMKAIKKQTVAVSRVGIISTPNQPTYRRFSVLVTQLQNCSHKFARSARCNVVVMVL